MPTFTHALDPTGINTNNLVTGENAQGIGSPNRLIKPEYGPYFVESLIVVDNDTNTTLVKGVDYDCVGLVQEATIKFQKPIAEFIKLKRPSISATVRIQYQALGGLYENSNTVLANLWNSYINDNRLIDFKDGLIDKPFEYPPSLHPTLFKDISNFEPLISAIERLTQAVTISNVPAFQNLVDWFEVNLANSVPELVSVDDLATMAPSNKLITLAALVYVLDRYTIPTDRITGTLPVSKGGTSATTAAGAFNNIKQHASTIDTGVIAIATDADIAEGTSENKSVNPKQLKDSEIRSNEILEALLDVKADKISPTFTGTPTAPTPAEWNNSTLIATTAFVQTTAAAVAASAVASATVPDATTTVAGKVMLAAAADTTSTNKAVTPAILKSGLDGKSDTSHTHSEYAASSHSHSGYASTTHRHELVNFNHADDWEAYGNWDAVNGFNETTVSYKSEYWTKDIYTSTSDYVEITVLMLGQVRSVSAHNDTSQFNLLVTRLNDNFEIVNRTSQKFIGDQATNQHVLLGRVFTGGGTFRIKVTYFVQNLEPPAGKPMVICNLLTMVNIDTTTAPVA